MTRTLIRRSAVVATTGALALGALVVPLHAAGAGDAPTFCAPMQKGFDAISGVEITDFDRLGTAFSKGARQFRKAAKSAPSDLRRSIRRVAKLFDKVADLDVSDIGDIAELAVKTQVDFERIRAGVKEQCGIDIPQVPIFD